MFIVVGAGLLLSPVWAYWKALRTIYAITDRRAILISAPWKREVHSFDGQQLMNVHRVENDCGEGDIVFHRQAVSGNGGDHYYDCGFLGIDRVRDVDDLLRDLYKNSVPK